MHRDNPRLLPEDASRTVSRSLGDSGHPDDELGRLALVQKGYHWLLGLKGLESACGKGQYATIDFFLDGYDLLQEYGCFEVELPPGEATTTS